MSLRMNDEQDGWARARQNAENPERPVRVHPTFGAPYGQRVGQRVNLGRVGLGQTARVTYEPQEDEGSTL